jgi:hypothetical protein
VRRARTGWSADERGHLFDECDPARRGPVPLIVFAALYVAHAPLALAWGGQPATKLEGGAAVAVGVMTAAIAGLLVTCALRFAVSAAWRATAFALVGVFGLGALLVAAFAVSGHHTGDEKLLLFQGLTVAVLVWAAVDLIVAARALRVTSR